MKNKIKAKNHTIVFTQACLLLGLGIFLTTCKDKETPDPCAGVERVSAEFVMGQRIAYSELLANPPFSIDTLVASDTALTGMVYFEAAELGEGVTYEWQVGNEQNTSTQRQFFLVFGDPVYNIPVRLIVRRPNSTCFAEGTDADTLVKYLTVIERSDNPIYGTYEGSLLSDPNDVFEVTLLLATPTNRLIININKGCNPLTSVGGNFAYKQLFFHIYYFADRGCLSPTGWAVLDEQDPDKVRINFRSRTFSDVDAPFIEDVFIGTRKE